jgi:hypothetical protein
MPLRRPKVKIVFFAFKGDHLCFIHVMLNALDLKAGGHTAGIVFEGEATKLIPELARDNHPLAGFYRKIKDNNLIEGACRACSAKMGVLDAVEKEAIPLLDDMAGHPGMARFVSQGYQIVTL